MSTTDLARARIAGSLRGLGWPFLFTVMLTLGSCSFWLLIDKENPSTILINRWSVTQLAGILILVFLGIAAGAWAAYWTGSIFFAVAMYMGLLLMVAPLHLLDAYGLVPMTYDELVLERLAYAIAALVMLAVLFRGVYRKHLSATRLGITLFISGAFSFALWFASYWDDIWSTREIQWGLRDFPEYVLFALFITLPLATIPLTLHWARHR